MVELQEIWEERYAVKIGKILNVMLRRPYFSLLTDVNCKCFHADVFNPISTG